MSSKLCRRDQEDKGYFNKVCTASSQALFPASHDKNVFFLVHARHFSQGVFYLLLLRIKKGQSALLAPTVSEMPFTKNNQYILKGNMF